MEDTVSYAAYMKSPFLSVKHSTYFEIYDRLFLPYRNKNVTFLEIGILSGGSLFMWREFFGPDARIIGVDLNPGAKKWEDYGFEIYIGNQSDEVFWTSIKEKIGEIDIILDDGGHTYEQQIITFEALIGNIKDGGLFVVEDTHTSYMNGFGPPKYSFIEYTKILIDRVNQRFGDFRDVNEERRVWSIQFFESIVSFSINKMASYRQSEPVENNGITDNALEIYRYSDKKGVKILYKIAKRIKIIRSIPGVDRLGRIFRAYIVARNFNARRFFR